MNTQLLDNPRSERVGKYRQLLEKKQREKTGLMLVEGISPVEQLVRNHADLVQDLIVDVELLDQPRVQDVYELYEYSKTATREVVNAISKDAQGIVAVAKTRIEVPETNVGGPVVVLNNIQDPGNAGTIVRAAAAFGARKVIFAGESVDHWNPKVVRASVGGVFQLPIASVLRLADAVKLLRQTDYHIIAADLHGTKSTPAKSIKEFKAVKKPLALVFGNEAHGLTSQEVDLADECLYIPLSPEIESLNLSGSVNIFLFALS